MSSRRAGWRVGLTAALLLLAAGCLSRTAPPEYTDFEGAAVPVQVIPRYEGKHKVWEFRIVLTNNTGQDLRLVDYDVAIVGTDTGYTSRWTVVPSRETLVKAYGSYGYTTDYRTISRFHSGKQLRTYRVVGVRDGTEYRADFGAELLN
jgi:hypothetical protein